MKQEIFAQIVDAKEGNKESMLKLIKKFEPALKRYAYALGSEDAYSELIVSFMSVVQSMDFESIRNKEDSGLVKYLYSVIYHKFVELLKKQCLYSQKQLLVDDIDDVADVFTNKSESSPLRDSLLLSDLSQILTTAELEIIHLHYFSGYSIQEIANTRRTSRQAVNKIRSRALQKIKTDYYEQLNI